jgi:hypothetical protein
MIFSNGVCDGSRNLPLTLEGRANETERPRQWQLRLQQFLQRGFERVGMP